MAIRSQASTAGLPQGSVDGWIDRTARIGYATKGIVYVVIGVLAVRAAFNVGGSTEGARGAILEIGSQPFGRILLALTAAGLFGYSLWRFIAAGVDPDRDGSDAKGIAKRLGYAVSGGVYLGLSIWAARIALGGGSGNGGGSEDAWTAKIMAQPFGVWLVALVGAVIVAVGLHHFYRAYSARFMRRYDHGAMNQRQRLWARRLGRFGLSARGVTFVIIGGFLIQAARQSDPSETGGLPEALRTLEQQAYGPWLLGIVAVGFVAYGAYCISRARFSTFSAR